MKQITTLTELKKLGASGIECYIRLNGGLRSSKYIEYDGNRFHVLNEIDGTWQRLTPRQLMSPNYTNIGRAMKLGALIRYN